MKEGVRRVMSTSVHHTEKIWLFFSFPTFPAQFEKSLFSKPRYPDVSKNLTKAKLHWLSSFRCP